MNGSKLTFEQKRDRKAEAMKKFAFPSKSLIFWNLMINMNNLEISTKLHELQEKRNKHNPNEENLGKINSKEILFYISIYRLG